jgi:hypothetical protein
MYMKTVRHLTPILESCKLRNPFRTPKATEAEAKAMDREAIRIIAEVKSNWLRLGLVIERVSRTEAFVVLGFRSIHSWMEARLGGSMASGYSALRSVRALKDVPDEKLKRIGERNAHALTRLPERERKSDEWVEKAAKLSIREFKREVETAIEKKTGIPQERFKTWWIALPEAVYDSMCEAERKLARSLGIDIETNPGTRVQLWEAFSQWILQTDEETIKVQTEGI